MNIHLRSNTHLCRSDRTCTSVALQCASRAPYLHASTSQHLQRAPDLKTSIPPYRYACSASPGLQSSILPCLHVATPTMHLQGFMPPCLHISTSLHLRRASGPLYLQASTSLHL